MRMSRVLLAGAAVAAAGIATSAFTAGTTVQDSIAGSGDSTVTGANTEHIDYILNADKSQVDEIRFELVGDFTDAVTNEGLVAWLTVKWKPRCWIPWTLSASAESPSRRTASPCITRLATALPTS